MKVYKISKPENPNTEGVFETPQEIADYLEDAEVNEIFTIAVEEMTQAEYDALPELEEF